MRRSYPTRKAFTLVEMMVSAALCLFLMTIITTAFKSGIDTFRQLRSAGNMQDKLRAAILILRSDLGAEHFEGPFQPGLSGPYLSDQRLDLPGWTPPKKGFFSIRQGRASQPEWVTYDASTTSYVPVIDDGNGLRSTFAAEHMLHFTVRLPNGSPANLFSATGPSGGVVNSRWAEVCYFLHQEVDTANGTPLYSLRRRQRVVLPQRQSLPGAAGFPEIAANTSSNITLDPADLTIPANRIPIGGTPPGPAPFAIGSAQEGDDVLMTNVLSFEVKVCWVGNSTLLGPTVTPPMPSDYDYPFADLPVAASLNTGARYFDTWYRSDATVGTSLANSDIDWDDINPASNLSSLKSSTKVAPLRICIRAVQIRLRIWDEKAQQARQVTIVQQV